MSIRELYQPDISSVMNPDGTVNIEGLSRVTKVEIKAPSDTASLKATSLALVEKSADNSKPDMITIGYGNGQFVAMLPKENKTESFIVDGVVIESSVNAINEWLSNGEYYYVGLSAGPGGATNEEMLNALDEFIKVKTT